MALHITTLYHGSRKIVDKPVFGEVNPRNDYGLGFYCTHDLELAKEWACTDEADGYANQYELDLADLSVMRLSETGFNILNWLALLLANRTFRISNDIAAEGKASLLSKFLPDIQLFDVIIGYRADDSYFSFANGFLNNTLSLDQLRRAMHLGELGEQTVLRSRATFDRIKYIQSVPASRVVYYPKKSARDTEARSSYRSERARSRAADSVYLLDILRGCLENGDARI